MRLNLFNGSMSYMYYLLYLIKAPTSNKNKISKALFRQGLFAALRENRLEPYF